MPFITKKISYKLLSVSSLVGLIILGILNYFAYKDKLESLNYENYLKIRTIAIGLKDQIDAGLHFSLAESFPNQDEIHKNNIPADYQKLHGLLKKAKVDNELESEIYTLVFNESKREEIANNPNAFVKDGMQFIITSASDPYYRHHYDYKPEMYKVFSQQKIVELTPYKSANGHWISVIAPIVFMNETIALLELDINMKKVYHQNDKAMMVQIGYAIGSGILFILILLVSIKTITNPIKVLTQHAVNFGKGNLEQEITVSSEDEIGVLAGVLDNARVEIDGFISRILNTFPGLMISLDKEGRIQGRVSKMAEQMFGNCGEEFCVDRFFNSDVDFRKVLEMAFDEKVKMPFKDVINFAPERIQYASNIFKMDYYPIYKNEMLEGVLLIGLDITKEEEIKKNAEKEHDENLMVMTIVKSRNHFELMAEEWKKGYERALEIIKSDYSIDTIHELFRIIHTFKGGVMTFNIKSVGSVAHELERKLDNVREGKEEFDSPSVEQEINSLNEGFHYVVNKVVGILGSENKDLKELTVNEVKQIKDAVVKNDLKIIQNIMDHMDDVLIKNYLESKAKSVFDQVIEVLEEKECQLIVQSEDIRVPANIIEILNAIMPHMIRNCLDHGIETMDVRLDANKEQSGSLKISSVKQGEKIIITFEDDGGGVNPDFVASKAHEKGLVSEEELAGMSIAEKQELIFLPGFSTVDVANDISGRGVGMDAIKHVVEQNRGNISLISEVGKGSQFKVELPLN